MNDKTREDKAVEVLELASWVLSCLDNHEWGDEYRITLKFLTTLKQEGY